MEPEVKKAMLSMLLLPPAYAVMVLAMLYSFDNDTPYPAIVGTAFAMIVVVFVLRYFFSKTLFKGKVPYSPVKHLEPIGSLDEKETKDLNITISGYVARMRFTLSVDGVVIAEAGAGERLRIPVAKEAHMLTVKSGVSTETPIPPGDTVDIYIWCDRNVKNSSDVIKADDATGGIGACESKDAISYAKAERTLKLIPLVGGVVSVLMIAVIFMLP